MRMGLYRHYYLRIPRRQKKRLIAGSIFCAVLFCVVSSLVIFYKNVGPVLTERAEHYASETAAEIVSQAVSTVFAENDITYQNLMTIEKNSAGQILSIQSNSGKINQLRNALDQAIRREMEKRSDGYIRIPFGSILKHEAFAAMGPKIKVKINLSGKALLDFQDEFESVGINQTKHKIYLDAALTLSMISAAARQEETVHYQIPVAETIIIGSVPQYYSGRGYEIPSIADK